MQYTITSEIFEKFPLYVRGVVVASGLTNGDSPPELVRFLREAEDAVRTKFLRIQITEQPTIAAWRSAYRRIGVRPSGFRCSIEAMSRRIVRGDSLPSINRLVDIVNVLSLKHFLSAGCHAFDFSGRDLELRLAHGGETFVPLGRSDNDPPEPGEVILGQGNMVLTRRWTWRQGQYTVITVNSRYALINIDGLPPTITSEVSQPCSDATKLILEFCGGEISTKYLTKANPSISVG